MLELDGATLTYEVFRDSCLRPNRPAIIRNASRDALGVTCFDLAALKRRLSPRELCRSLGSQVLVPVYPVPSTARVATSVSKAAAVGEEVDDERSCCEEMPLRVVLHSWAKLSTAPCSSSDSSFSSAPHVYYLKDWHLQAALESAAATATTTSSFPSLPTLSGYAKCRSSGIHGDGLYRVPSFLGPDWMDPFCCRHRPPQNDACSTTLPVDDHVGTSPPMGFGNGEGDYRFCYIGPVGSWTPLHCDVFGTYSWSLNVCGDKQWFFPTMAGNKYLHSSLVPLFPTPPDIRVLTGIELDSVVQHPGDLVFVPAFFYHQVHNITGEVFHFFAGEGLAVEDHCGEDAAVPLPPTVAGAQLSVELTVALNHNWCNAFNIERMTMAFLADAQRLASHLSVDDLAVICDTDDPAVWRQFADRMLHNGTNWSFASMVCFLGYCLARIDSAADVALGSGDERSATADQLRRLRGRVAEEYARLFDKKP
ncbi:hypothetical protein JKF63_03296 [Porcisia hertigi]|uniref:JmjC domain-containing protein n=1 Tax=Porcisia hertigi TaxID=2761500 RepID=A0A836IAD1_9TRYP|nr:hypothetical protein JKF63_03296 [Porcisia hertigi]